VWCVEKTLGSPDCDENGQMSSGVLAELRKVTDSFMTSVRVSLFVTTCEILFGEFFLIFLAYSGLPKSAKNEDHVGCRSERPSWLRPDCVMCADTVSGVLTSRVLTLWCVCWHTDARFVIDCGSVAKIKRRRRPRCKQSDDRLLNLLPRHRRSVLCVF